MAAEYVIELYDGGASFGPGTKVAEIWDARNLGWSRYDRLPGKAFCTLYQSSSALAKLSPLLSHVKITRIRNAVETLVFSGGYMDLNSTGDDVVLEFYDYLSLLSLSRSGFRTMYPTKALGTEIASPEWVSAKGATGSIVGFVTTGTIEDPLGTDGVTVIKTNAQFGTMDQSRLQLIFDLSEMGRANTINNVTFHISRTSPHTFTFLKNAGSNVDVPLVLNGTVNDYSYAPGWKRYRNDIATIGMNAAGGTGEIVKTDGAEITAKGLRQDVTAIKTLLGIVGAATEADQQQAVLARALKTATKQQPWLSLQLVRNTIDPFVGWDIGDKAPVEIGNGTDSIAERRRIVGVRGMVTEAGEDLNVMLEAILT
jgi:hypothetical protein